MFSPYGRSTLGKTFLICILLALAGLFSPGVVKPVLIGSASCIALFTLYFFRDPSRKKPDGQDIVLAPADGRVVLIKKMSHPYTGPDSTCVSIFMSIFNVHVNRIPASGRITHLAYHPGNYHMAFDHKSMNDNERMEIGIEQRKGNRVFFTQVAGFAARRIVCNLDIGDTVQAGERFGMIKFGSRLDIIVPEGVILSIAKGQKCSAGETVIGTFNTLN